MSNNLQEKDFSQFYKFKEFLEDLESNESGVPKTLFLVGDEIYDNRKSAELAQLKSKVSGKLHGYGYPIMEKTLNPLSDDELEDFLENSTANWGPDQDSKRDTRYKKGMGTNWNWAKD